VIIAEHGDYPHNDKGQTLYYPRYEFFQQVVKVFEAKRTQRSCLQRQASLHRVARNARRWSRTRSGSAFPFLGGFFVAGKRARLPAIDLPWGHTASSKVSVRAYGGVDGYDFHGLETAQCMSERRRGGEVGIKSVQALRGAKMWERVAGLDKTQRPARRRSHRAATICPSKNGYPTDAITFDWARRVFSPRGPSPTSSSIATASGTTLFMLPIQDFNYAGLDGEKGCDHLLPDVSAHAGPKVRRRRIFFNPLVHHIERMVLENRAPYPVERTLLTSGMTAGPPWSRCIAMGAVVETPEMEVRYTAPQESLFWQD